MSRRKNISKNHHDPDEGLLYYHTKLKRWFLESRLLSERRLIKERRIKSPSFKISRFLYNTGERRSKTNRRDT